MEELKHSSLGVASFVTSIVSGLFIFVVIVFAGFVEVSTPGGMDEDSAVTVGLGLLLFLFGFVLLVALGLGIAGLVQNQHKKLFAVLGTVFSVALLVGTITLMAIGSS